MEDNFYALDCENDVVNLGNDAEKFFVDIPMLKLGELLQHIKSKLLHISLHDWEKKKHEEWFKRRKEWLSEGKDCEILHLGEKNWQKGKVRIKITVEFCPDEPISQQPSSPLDDIRQTLDRVS